MKMDTKKLAAIFAILMIALGIAGFAYAHWSEFIYIEGEVTTGHLDLEWSFDYKFGEGNYKEGYGDVAYIKYEIDDGYLWVGLYNAYPSLTVEMWIDVHNTGTIPVKLYDYDCGLEEGSIDLRPWIKIVSEEWLFLDTNKDGVEPSLKQLDPCDTIVYHVVLHFEQTDAYGNLLPENAWMGFWAEFEWVNWNAP